MIKFANSNSFPVSSFHSILSRVPDKEMGPPSKYQATEADLQRMSMPSSGFSPSKGQSIRCFLLGEYKGTYVSDYVFVFFIHSVKPSQSLFYTSLTYAERNIL